MITGQIQPTAEQLAVIDACAAGAHLVIEAGAGTGKTSTLRLAADAMKGLDGLYIAYNRATADAARRSFPSHVRCATAHSLAYAAAGYQYSDRLPGRSARMPAWAVASQLAIGAPLLLGRDRLLTAAHLARLTMATIERFCYSADTEISARHVPSVAGLNAASTAELSWHLVPYAKRAWLDLQRPGSRLPVQHDHYLKIWQLTSPAIPAAFIMFDEAQDANPVTAAIIASQHNAQHIIVGDSCQAIYGWRGATDALADWPADCRLHLTRSFRFGTAVAAEANKWLDVLGARHRLMGTGSLRSAVGPVADPQVILCRTNAEALTQARSLLEAGRRVALADGAAHIRSLAIAALDLQASGQTSNPELAAFRSWHDVQDYARTDAAGADLAASIRLIDKYGAVGVLTTIEKLSPRSRAEITVSTVHAAKGREWERVLIAGDFREPGRRGVPRADAMLAYVAVTRARRELDQTGLAWIDEHLRTRPVPAASAIRTPSKEAAMTSVSDPLRAEASGPRPYAGGRAQAESGSHIIRNDYDAWVSVSGGSGLAAGHPRLVQFGQAWRAVAKHGLDAEPGHAATRYHVLAHAVAALAEALGSADQSAKTRALRTLASHSRAHADRLAATALELFTRSPQAGPYTGGRGQATSGSRIIEKDYLTWTRTPAAALIKADECLREHADRLQHAWDKIRQHGLADGPGPAATRYLEFAGASKNLADSFSTALPSGALAALLDLTTHARKHAIRLHATAEARLEAAGGAPHERQMAAEVARFLQPAHPAEHHELPSGVAKVTSQAHSIAGHRSQPTDAHAKAETVRRSASRRHAPDQERER